MRFCAAALASALALAAPVAGAQEKPEPRLTGEAWYEAQLVELSRVLGGAHYLRILCGGRSDQRWRDYMRGVLSREPERQGVLVAGFNEGYRREEARFEDCDQSAEQTEAELRAQGLRIADGLAASNDDARAEQEP